MYRYVEFNINSLLCAFDKGNGMAETFMQEGFIKVERQETHQKSFYDPLPKGNVKTMADMQKTFIVKAKSIAMNGEVMYLCLFAIYSVKVAPLERVLSSENAPALLTIFNENSSLIVCVKSDFIHNFESMYETKVTTMETTDVYI